MHTHNTHKAIQLPTPPGSEASAPTSRQLHILVIDEVTASTSMGREILYTTTSSK